MSRYVRLIKETDTEIHVSSEGMDIPGVECVRIETAQTPDKIENYYWLYFKVIFEDNRIVAIGVASINSFDSYRFIDNNSIRKVSWILKKSLVIDTSLDTL